MKIFVGGLPHDLTHEEFKSFFERFGTIKDIVIIHQKETRRSRGFGFVSFESEEVVKNVLQNQFYELKNKRVEVKRATPKEERNINNVESSNFPILGYGDLANSYVYYFPNGLTNNQTYNVYLGRSYYGPWFNQNPIYPYGSVYPAYYYYQPSGFGQTNGKWWQ